MADERVMVFIDGSNLYHSLRSDHGRTDLDFRAFALKLASGRHLIRTYYYNATVDNTKEAPRAQSQQRFFQKLRSLPATELRLGRLVYRDWPTSPPYEKGIDIKIATDMLSHAHRKNCDVAILVSGDTDFADALQEVKDCGVSVEVALFGPRYSSQRLRDVADEVIVIDGSYLAGSWV